MVGKGYEREIKNAITNSARLKIFQNQMTFFDILSYKFLRMRYLQRNLHLRTFSKKIYINKLSTIIIFFNGILHESRK